MSGCSCSAGVKGGWQPGSGGEQLLEGVEFVDAPLGGGVQVGLHDREVDQSLQGAPPEVRCWTLTGRTALSASLLVLSRYRDKTNYADVRVMPMSA